jgi:hypothetical protein
MNRLAYLLARNSFITMYRKDRFKYKNILRVSQKRVLSSFNTGPAAYFGFF